MRSLASRSSPAADSEAQAACMVTETASAAATATAVETPAGRGDAVAEVASGIAGVVGCAHMPSSSLVPGTASVRPPGTVDLSTDEVESASGHTQAVMMMVQAVWTVHFVGTVHLGNGCRTLPCSAVQLAGSGWTPHHHRIPPPKLSGSSGPSGLSQPSSVSGCCKDKKW